MYNPLTDIAMLLGYDVVHILSAIESSKSLQKAKHDYEQNGGYNYGTTLKGKQMKRRTSQKDLMELISYDSVVGSVVGLQTGNRPRLTESEKPYFRRWIEDLDKTYKRNTEEEDEVYYDGWGYAHSLAEERRKRKENPNIGDDDGLPILGNDGKKPEVKLFDAVATDPHSGLPKFDRNIEPEELDDGLLP